MKQARLDETLRGFIEQFDSVFDGFFNRLGCEIFNSFQIGLDNAYSDNLVDCPVSLTHFLGSAATSVYWQFDSKEGA